VGSAKRPDEEQIAEERGVERTKSQNRDGGGKGHTHRNERQGERGTASRKKERGGTQTMAKPRFAGGGLPTLKLTGGRKQRLDVLQIRGGLPKGNRTTHSNKKR